MSQVCLVCLGGHCSRWMECTAGPGWVSAQLCVWGGSGGELHRASTPNPETRALRGCFPKATESGWMETTQVYSRTMKSMASPVSFIPDPSLLLLRTVWRTQHKRNNSCVSGPDYGPQIPWHSPDFQSSVPMPHLDQTMCPG